MRALLIALVAVAASPVWAQPSVQVTVDACRRLVRHVPAPDVAYQPGVDAYGRAVAPADVESPPPLGPRERMTLAIGADLRRFGIPATSPLFDPTIAVGEITFDGSGTVLFNGRPLGRPEQAALAELCRARLPRPR